MAGKLAALSFFTLIFTSGLTAQVYTKDQFSHRVDETTTAIRKAEKIYKNVEKEVQRHFPEGTRRSPLYLAIRDDFMEYREIMKRLNDNNISFNRSSEEYSKLFGGVFGGKDEISTEDDEFDKVNRLAGELEEVLTVALNDLSRAAPLSNVLRTMLDRISDIKKFRDNLNGHINTLTRNVERSSRENEGLFRLFTQTGKGMMEYGVYHNADSVRTVLSSVQQEFSSRRDSLRLLLEQTNRLLSGIAKRGEELRVWETVEHIIYEQEQLVKSADLKAIRIDNLRNELDDLLKLMSEFSDILSDMGEDIALLRNNYQKAVKSLEEDSLRYSSLMGKMVKGYTVDKLPYRELKKAYHEADDMVENAEVALRNMAQSRQDLIDHVSGMKGLKNDSDKFSRLKDLNGKFNTAYKSGEKTLKQLEDGIERLREVIIKFFVNTTEYWELLYKVESEKSFGGEEIVVENYGYLYDPNALPEEDYHGRFISTFQLKLEKNRERGKQLWNYYLVFSGEHDFPLEGFILQSSDGITLIEVSKESVFEKEEKNKNDRVKFKWRIPLQQTQLDQIIKPGTLTLRIHLLTVTHRVNLTLFRKKVYRDYLIPKRRKQMWSTLLNNTV